MASELSQDIEQAVALNHGCLKVNGRRSMYFVISMDAFREMMGVGSDEELADSLKAIEEGLADIAAGRTRPFRDALAELN